jgi:hypothetical protein
VIRFKRTAAMEACIQKMCELLYDVLENTKRQVEKKLTLTHDELEQEMLDEDEGVADIDMEDDDDEDEIPIYNPLNLPVMLVYTTQHLPEWSDHLKTKQNKHLPKRPALLSAKPAITNPAAVKFPYPPRLFPPHQSSIRVAGMAFLSLPAALCIL